jgi:hypothetical protein
MSPVAAVADRVALSYGDGPVQTLSC